MSQFDVAIVGGGIVGAASAYYLTRKGHKVILLDQYGVPNEWAASGDHARVFRLTYGKDLFYTELAVRSLEFWKEFQKEVREDLYVPTGMLDLAVKEGGYEEACYRALKEMRLPVAKLAPEDVRERYRVINPKAMRFAVLHPDGGILWAQRAVAAFATAASRRHATVFKNITVTRIIRGKDGVRELQDASGRSFKASAYIFAAGPWTRELLADYGLPLKVTRQQLLYFRPPRHQGRYRPGPCPVFACMSKGYYVLPVHIHGFMKIGDHRKGPAGRPGPGPQELTPQFVRSCRSFLKEFVPDLCGFADTEGKICYYNNTPDDDFILDRLPDCPNAYVAAGLSGHGFKFGPLLGALLAELVTHGKTDLNISRFRLGRFRLRARR